MRALCTSGRLLPTGSKNSAHVENFLRVGGGPSAAPGPCGPLLLAFHFFASLLLAAMWRISVSIISRDASLMFFANRIEFVNGELRFDEMWNVTCVPCRAAPRRAVCE
jgi:hypothetical protein